MAEYHFIVQYCPATEILHVVMKLRCSAKMYYCSFSRQLSLGRLGFVRYTVIACVRICGHSNFVMEYDRLVLLQFLGYSINF
jgi:hypothetical protein